MQRIGFVGLGIMGSGMVKNLVKKGHSVSVWNRSPERIQALGVSVRAFDSPKSLAENSDVVFTCVADPQAVERVVFADDGVIHGARPGLRYVECSTVSPELVRQIAVEFAARGAAAMEAPVTGSRNAAEAGTLLFMTGGPAALHAELEPLLLAMGSRAIRVGESGEGALMKLIGNSLISYMLTGLAEGFVVAEKSGLSLERVLEVIMAAGFQSPYFAFKGKALLARDFFPHFALDLMVKDQSLMLAEAEKLRMPMPGLAAIREVFQAARAQGFGSEDMVAIIKSIERAAGIGNDSAH